VVDHQPSFVRDAREALTRFPALFRRGLPALLLAGALHAPVALGTVRTGDATHVYALERHANAMALLERELMSSIDKTSGDERFNLYWTYNLLTGTWLQIDRLEALLEASIETASFADEERVRTALRDQAQFARAELDHAVADLEHNAAAITRHDRARLNEAVCALLADVRITVDHLLADP
jgi:hypothetical protein